jgi:filamentous hemagglutinin
VTLLRRNKRVYDIIGHPDEIVAVLKSGKPVASIDDEIALLKKLSDNDLPVVEILEKGTFEGQPAIVMKKYAQGSKDVVKLVNGKIEKVGSSTLLNQKSVADLTNIQSLMESKKIWVNDLQFLIAKDGRVVIADPLDVVIGKGMSDNNKRMIKLLIEVAQGK